MYKDWLREGKKESSETRLLQLNYVTTKPIIPKHLCISGLSSVNTLLKVLFLGKQSMTPSNTQGGKGFLTRLLG